MKINKIYSAISVALFATALTACSSFQEDDLFDESASLRITKFNEDLQARLVEQSTEGKYGWVIQYFVGSESKGYNLFGRFDASGKVTLASNHPYLRGGNANKYTEYVSSYEMLREDGPVLAFNTWNDVLTVFVDPVDPSQAPSTIVNDGEGMKGDHNFLFHAYEGQNILFRGQRHAAGIRFVPCDRPWEDYITDADAFKNSITNSTFNNFYVTDGKDTMYFSGLNNGLFTYQERLIDPLQSEPCACVFSVDGFRLKNKSQLGEKSFQNFTISDQKDCLYNEDKTVRVIPTWDNYIINTRTAVWNYEMEQMSNDQKVLLEQINAELRKYNKNYSIAQVGLGQSKGKGAINGLVITFYTNAAKTKTNTAGVALTNIRTAYGQMQISYSDANKVDGNLESLGKKSDIVTVARQFAATLSGTFNIVPNDYFLPTGCELHAVDGGSNYILK